MVVIRKAELEEVVKILDIEAELFGEENVGTYECIFKQIEDYGYWFRTAKIDGIIVGFINGIPVEGEADTVKIISAGVKPELQKQGIGDLLMKSFIFIAQQKGIQKIVLACGKEHAEFFEKYGFVSTEAAEGVKESASDSAVYNMEMITTEIRCGGCGNH